MGKKAAAISPASGILPLSEDQLVDLSLKELRHMNLSSLLDTLQQLGYSTETIKTRTQALTRLDENVVGSTLTKEDMEV